MSGEPKEPEGQAAESTQPDEGGPPKLREVSAEELKEILAAHKKWLRSDRKRRPPRGFFEADLRKKNLRNAKLAGAFISKANLEGADLHEANLQGATLSRTVLKNANLFHANLRYCNLHNADLTNAPANPRNPRARRPSRPSPMRGGLRSFARCRRRS